MPRLIAYIPRLRPSRSYDEAELARLELVYDRACTTLQIGLPDPRREKLAAIVFRIADLSNDPDDLLSRAVALFQQR